MINRPQVYISPTRVKMFLECKFKFQQKYIFKTNPTNTTPPHVFGPGQTVHKLAELYDVAKFTHTDEQKAVDIRKYMKENKLEDMFFNSIAEQYEVVIRYLKPFIERREAGEIKLSKETKINNLWFGNFWFYGFADLRANWDDKAIITDYKSSKSEDDHDIQLAIYCFNTAKTLKIPVENIETHVLYTKLDKKVVKVFTVTELKEVLRHVADIIRQSEQAKEFPKCPNVFCSNCEYYSLCKPNT